MWWRAVVRWWRESFIECPKERLGYVCHHRPNECGWPEL